MKIFKKDEVLNLFKEQKINYAEGYHIEYKPLLALDAKDSDYYYDNKEEFDNLAEVFGNCIRKREIASVYIGKTESKGFGLFAREDIPENTFIGIYTGSIKEQQEMVAYDENGFDTDYAWDYPDEIDGHPILEVDAKYYGNEMRFSNHDRCPNLRVEHTIIDNLWYIFFVSDSDIKKDEELTISYGEAYWDTEYREQY